MENEDVIDYDQVIWLLRRSGFDENEDGFSNVCNAIYVRLMDNGDMSFDDICNFIAKMDGKTLVKTGSSMNGCFYRAQKRLRKTEKFGFLTCGALKLDGVDLERFVFTLADTMEIFISKDAPHRERILRDNLNKPMRSITADEALRQAGL